MTEESKKAWNISKLTINQYDHGGSRICFYGDNPKDRELLCDTYHTREFSEYIFKCTQAYFKGERLDSFRSSLIEEIEKHLSDSEIIRDSFIRMSELWVRSNEKVVMYKEILSLINNLKPTK